MLAEVHQAKVNAARQPSEQNEQEEAAKCVV
jgi:hypothetical protein